MHCRIPSPSQLRDRNNTSIKCVCLNECNILLIVRFLLQMHSSFEVHHHSVYCCRWDVTACQVKAIIMHSIKRQTATTTFNGQNSQSKCLFCWSRPYECGRALKFFVVAAVIALFDRRKRNEFQVKYAPGVLLGRTSKFFHIRNVNVVRILFFSFLFRPCKSWSRGCFFFANWMVQRFVSHNFP